MTSNDLQTAGDPSKTADDMKQRATSWLAECDGIYDGSYDVHDVSLRPAWRFFKTCVAFLYDVYDVSYDVCDVFYDVSDVFYDGFMTWVMFMA